MLALGLEILSFSMVAVKPRAETARALEAEVREQILKAADDAIYARRNAAVENERAIKESELDTEVAVELKQRTIRETQMEAEAAVQKKQAELQASGMEAQIALEARRKEFVGLEADNTRTTAEAEAHRLGAVMQALQGADARIVQALAASGMAPGQLIAQAFGGIADKAERIGQLNMSPELLQLAAGAAGQGPGLRPYGTKGARLMGTAADRKVVLVTRKTRLEELLARYHSLAQARFYLEHLGADISDYQREHDTYLAAREQVAAVLSRYLRRQVVDRQFLPNFLFGPDDIVVALGQDGLVANTMKYLNGQPLLGVNPDPARHDGVLLPFQAGDLARVLAEAMQDRRPARPVTMARAELSDQQVLYAVNDFFIGPRSHTSARYEVRLGTQCEVQSSSGVIVSTGLGSTAWLKSIVTGARAIAQADAPYQALPWDTDRLVFAVREPLSQPRHRCHPGVWRHPARPTDRAALADARVRRDLQRWHRSGFPAVQCGHRGTHRRGGAQRATGAIAAIAAIAAAGVAVLAMQAPAAVRSRPARRHRYRAR
ncbi:hypothetical protein ACU4HD_25610 [Cupriavidus basilensis]